MRIPDDSSPGSSFVGRRFGVRLDSVSGEPLDSLVGLALRRNPKRAHLLVSTVLGKHIPTYPRVVHGAGLRLGALVGELLGSRPGLVLGYAETATGLGHCVAEALGADYLHSTRVLVDHVLPSGGFTEAHSHATDHALAPLDRGLLTRPGAVVLVDDELSTGATALDTIALLHRLCPHSRYVLAVLADTRLPDARVHLDAVASELATVIEVVALGAGTVGWPAEFPQQAQAFVADHRPEPLAAGPSGRVVEAPRGWPDDVKEGGRYGFAASEQDPLVRAAEAQAAALDVSGPRVLVLATEELMYAPLRIALALAGRPGLDVRFSSTTRSPVLAVDEPGYPIRTALTFDSSDGPRFAYNVAPPARADRFDEIVVVTDCEQPLLVEGLRPFCARLHVVRLPRYVPPRPAALRGPAFGSYAADEVSWLLTDLSDVALEAPVEEREEAVQSGGAHYAESLPIEYQPSAEYQRLFADALDESAVRLAHAVGVVTELVLDRRGPQAVLVSLARAGTPIGILMRRWAKYRHGLELAHYAVSIVRGKGIDPVALGYLAAAHDPATIMFVDGWTGKGAITRELSGALSGTPFSDELAVLADTGSCTPLFGTRDDFLIPSACLNSTVSGLVSRTVLNDRILAPGQFHGAKFYKNLAPDDVSATFLDRIAAEFASVADAVDFDWPVLRDSDRTPRWTGWAEVERISEQWGIGNVNLVKPGVGETTRVLLRRVPWRILIDPEAGADLRHVLLLAEQRGVPVEPVPGLAYSCVGLIHPGYTRGATGSDGRAVR